MANEDVELSETQQISSSQSLESSTVDGAVLSNITSESTISTSDGNKASTITKLTAQLKRLNDANTKYKNLLKLAKERIEKQEEEFLLLQQTNSSLSERLELIENERDVLISNAATLATSSDEIDRSSSVQQGVQHPSVVDPYVVRVCQMIQYQVSDDVTEIWALIEMQALNDEGSYIGPKYKEWKRFDSEAQLQDYVRRDTGEPIVLPAYSLSPEQSLVIREQAEQHAAKISDEYRRFRVKAELTRKQAETQIRELQSSLAQKVTHQIENSKHNKSDMTLSANNDNDPVSAQVRSLQMQVERLKMDMASQDARWKESYDTLLSENRALQSSGSEALLASQWRHRYENCLKEKEELQKRYNTSSPSSSNNDFEAKYRDLKESFRLYRKKAKEIFEVQQQQNNNGTNGSTTSSISAMNSIISNTSSAEAKLSYLKNLMINYLTADTAVQDHMIGAIGTILQFTPDEQQRINAKKATTKDASWF